MDENYIAFEADLYVRKSPITFVTFSRLNTNRTFWTIGTINFFEDENSQKEAMIRDKERLNYHDLNAFNVEKPRQQCLSAIGFCSIPLDRWNDVPPVIEKNLKEVYPNVKFTYSLRGQLFGQIVLDERITKCDFTNERGKCKKIKIK